MIGRVLSDRRHASDLLLKALVLLRLRHGDDVLSGPILFRP